MQINFLNLIENDKIVQVMRMLFFFFNVGPPLLSVE